MRNITRNLVRVAGPFLVVVLCSAAPALAEDAPPFECAGGIYEVRGFPLLPGAMLPDALIIENATVATASGCPATPLRTHLTPLGTEIRADWKDCGDGLRDVSLKGLIGPYCRRISGVVASDDVPAGEEFYAALCERGDSCLQPCRSNNDCPETDVCERVPGACKGPGLCRPVPPLCAEAAFLMCGCDGGTYLNECERRAAGVSLADAGACSVGE